MMCFHWKGGFAICRDYIRMKLVEIEFVWVLVKPEKDSFRVCIQKQSGSLKAFCNPA